MKKLLIYLEAYRKESITAPFFKLLEALMDLIVPLVVADIINSGIAVNNTEIITRDFIILLVLAIAGMCFSFVAQYFAAKASVGFACDLRQSLFDHIETFSYSQLDRMGTGTLITRMTSDINQLQTGVNLALRLLLRSPFIVFGAMIMAFTIDIPLAFVFALTIPVLCLIVFAIMLRSMPLFARAQAYLDELLSSLREDLTGVRIIRAFRKEEDEIRSFDQKSDALTKMNLFVGRLSALMNPLTYVIVNVATIVLIARGALRVETGILKQGDIVALYNYMAQIIVELIKLASLAITINRSLACADRVADVLSVEEDMKYGDRQSEEESKEISVEFDGVCFAYGENSGDALDDISFSVKRGEKVGIIGATGSGKSSIINLIPRFYDVKSGSVKVNGIDVKDYARGSLGNLVGVVPQKTVLFEGTIRDNMKFGKEDATDEEIRKALEAAQAKEVVEQRSAGLDARVEQNGRNFSGGQRQRLTIARALVKDPDILILDDSASALDFATDLKLRQAIRKLKKDLTVFIVSQRTSSVKDCDLILVLDDGKLVGKGRHEELLEECEVYREIYESQFRKESAQ